MGTVAWVEIATLNEGGESMTDFMTMLFDFFRLFFASLISLVLFDIFIKPRLCPSSATTTTTSDDDDNDATFLSHSTASTTTSTSISNANNSNAFNLEQITSATFSGS